ncbi:hypothetical protein [Phyllobacterium sp. P30BS-XVII]|uniref:hypothetical protein n=1 Tax=Phyllobacterium sp. P30BS-XVII TaxID=2587046 RepID=UPI0015FCE76E|nr:hypothetical protein [Phyllobacterium sp. P30BS-XVII]
MNDPQEMAEQTKLAKYLVHQSLPLAITTSGPSRPEAAILANSKNVVGTWLAGLTRKAPVRDIALQFEGCCNEYGYFEFGFRRSMEPELCRH